MLKKFVPALFILSLTACAPAPKTDEAVEPTPTVEVPAGDQAMAAETITFVGKSSIIDHPGHFMKFTIATTPAATFEETSVTAKIDLTSVMTDSEGLNGHLQREDFFNTAVYPEATFTSKSITKNADGTYAIEGDMTLKGVTKTATFTATVEGDMVRAHYDLPRQDFGVGNDSYGNKILDPLVPVDVRYIWQK